MNVSHFPLTPHDHQLIVLKRLLGSFPVVRFMNWQQINRSQWDKRPLVRTWRDLPQIDTEWRYKAGPWGSWQGVPLREIIRVANALGVRPWICIPDTAGDTLIRRMVASVIKQAKHRPIIEFSNEIWNTNFMQHHYAVEQGADSGKKPFQAALYWQASQTRKLAAAAQGAADVVVCGQFFNEWVVQQLLEECGDVVSALGVAPYLGRHQRAIETVNGVWRMRSMPTLAEEVSAEIDTDITQRFQSFKRLADRYNIELFAYEGGLHQAARNDHGRGAFEMEKIGFARFNRSIMGGNATYQLWKTWRENGGTVACPYSLSTIFKQQKSFFGHCELHDNEIRMLPKYLSARQALQA